MPTTRHFCIFCQKHPQCVTTPVVTLLIAWDLGSTKSQNSKIILLLKFAGSLNGIHGTYP